MCQEATELLWIGCVTGSTWIQKIKVDTLKPHINSQTVRPKVISHVTNGTIFFICSTSDISALLAALRTPAWWAAPKRWREGCRSKREKKDVWQIEMYSDELVFSCSDKFVIREKSDCIEKSGDTPCYAENLKAGWEEIENPTQRRVLKRGCKMHLSLQKRNETGSEEDVTGELTGFAYKTAAGENLSPE